MNVCIMGPIETAKYFGGVAVFDTGLAESYAKFGCNVLMLTEQQEEPAVQIENVEIVSARNNELIRKIADFKPDLTIASLTYGKYLHKVPCGKTVMFLHGFFNIKNYGFWKTIIASLYMRHNAKSADKTVAISAFTQAVNETIFDIKVDGVANIGTDSDFIRRAISHEKDCKREKGSIVYVGRIERAKGVDVAIDAFIGQENITFDLYGAGSLENEIRNKASEDNGANIKLKGRIDHNELINVYYDHDIFISLNSCEPGGTTCAEALLCGCKIISPKTGGPVEYLSKYPDRVRFIDPNNVSEIREAARELAEIEIDDIDPKPLLHIFDYRYTASQIAKITEAEGWEELIW